MPTTAPRATAASGATALLVGLALRVFLPKEATRYLVEPAVRYFVCAIEDAAEDQLLHRQKVRAKSECDSVCYESSVISQAHFATRAGWSIVQVKARVSHAGTHLAMPISALCDRRCAVMSELLKVKRTLDQRILRVEDLRRDRG